MTQDIPDFMTSEQSRRLGYVYSAQRRIEAIWTEAGYDETDLARNGEELRWTGDVGEQLVIVLETDEPGFFVLEESGRRFRNARALQQHLYELGLRENAPG